MITVIKMRGSKHSNDIREYEITSEGLIPGTRIMEYRDQTIKQSRR